MFKLLKELKKKNNFQKMYKIFTKNTIKLSCSCRGKISSKISSNNWRTINPPHCNHDCNCRNKSDCALDNKCFKSSIVYKAIASAANKLDKKYLGISGYGYRSHKKDFWHKAYINSTELSKCIWKLKDEGETPSITWKYNVPCQLST